MGCCWRATPRRGDSTEDRGDGRSTQDEGRTAGPPAQQIWTGKAEEQHRTAGD